MKSLILATCFFCVAYSTMTTEQAGTSQSTGAAVTTKPSPMMTTPQKMTSTVKPGTSNSPKSHMTSKSPRPGSVTTGSSKPNTSNSPKPTPTPNPPATTSGSVSTMTVSVWTMIMSLILFVLNRQH